ncbi:MAG: O-antigen ligase family protein [Nitrospina sp.]|jgi:O-antigen ligase|nr:O-antigen ligase family protein [Nitrospina sp.]MBT3855666.1 O-antigen ligase family protein [Nitrospina sp.]MBT4104464.1 O-antigen ligase family protein [Nitrospina sp.]MBT4390349.1 O-antigen ligase family protein [Nitrospina sp.]MBT4622148.1 O-antigen ligase family protein [Nitrospina sp.]
MGKSSFIFFALIVGVGSHSPYIPLNRYEFIILLSFSSLIFLFLNQVCWRNLDRNLIRFTPLTTSLLLFYSWCALGYFFTVRLELSFDFVVKYIGVILLVFGMVRYLKEEKQVYETLWVLLVFSGVISLFGVARQFYPSLLFATESPQPSVSSSIFPYLHSYSCYILTHLPLSCFFYLNTPNKNRKIISAIIFVLLFVSLGFTGSRGGQLVTGIMLMIMFSYLLFKKDYSGMKAMLAGLLISLTVYLMLVSVLRSVDPLEAQKPFEQSIIKREWKTDTVGQRYDFWRGAGKILKDNWLTGTGPWTFLAVYPHYSSGMTPPHAHSLYFQTASDSGLVGIGLLCACIFFFYRQVLRIWFKEKSITQDLVFYLGVVVAGFLIHSVIEYHWTTSLFLYLFSIWALLIDVVYRKRFPKKNVLQGVSLRRFSILSVGSILIGIFVIINFYLYERTIYRQIFPGQAMEDIQKFSDSAKVFCERCDMPYLVRAGSLVREYERTGNTYLLKEAENELQRGGHISDYITESASLLARIQAFQGNPEAARETYLEGLKYKSFKVTAAIGLNVVDDFLEKMFPGFRKSPVLLNREPG